MAEFTLQPRKMETLTVNYGDFSFEIPIEFTLSETDKLRNLKTVNEKFDYLKQFLPDELQETMPISDVAKVINAWAAEVQRINNMTVGESQALRSS